MAGLRRSPATAAVAGALVGGLLVAVAFQSAPDTPEPDSTDVTCADSGPCEVVLIDVDAEGATVSVDGRTAALAVGESAQFGPRTVTLLAVDGEVLRLRVEETPESLPRAELARRVAMQLGLDARQVDCPDDLPMVLNASARCIVPVDAGERSEEAVVRVTDLIDGDVVLEVLDPDGRLTAQEQRWVEALRDLQGGEEPLYFDAAALDAATLQGWAAAAGGCTETLDAAGSPGSRLAEAARRAGLGCQALDSAAAAFEAAAARAGSSAEADVLFRVQSVKDGVDRWKYGTYLLEEAWGFAKRGAPGVG